MEAENNDRERFDVDVNYKGEDRGFRFDPQETIRALRHEALDVFEVKEDRELTMLYADSGDELPDTSTLREAGIKEGEVLNLRLRDVTVIFNGEGKKFRYERDETVKSLLDKALSAFNVTVNPHTMSLFLASGVELKDEALTLRDAGVRAGDELFLRTSQVKGGSWQPLL
jgi:Ubiquitin family